LNYEPNAGKSVHRTLGTHEQQSIWEIPVEILTQMKSTKTLKLDADIATGEPCVVYIGWKNIAWYACVGHSRIDIGTTGGVIHLLWDEESESPRNPKKHSQKFTGSGTVYWPETDMESLGNELSEYFAV
jgi:hypothetical protein